MEISKGIESALKVISENQLDVKKTYKLQRSLAAFGKFQLLRPTYVTEESEIYCGDVTVPVRIFFPSDKEQITDVILFFHGGGWVTGDIDSYNRVCAVTARQTGCRVISVGYRLAPENKFPCGFDDCFEVTKFYFENSFSMLGISSDRITIMGDSAGGNLAAAVALKARDMGEFKINRMILIYPATNNDHSETSRFESIRTNGSDYVLTSARIREYTELYERDENDRKSPYFAPLLAESFADQPETLIITAEFDPLRDEGEEYGVKLNEAGGNAKVYRMKQAIHGFFSLPAGVSQVKKSYELINDFLKGETSGSTEKK